MEGPARHASSSQDDPIAKAVQQVTARAELAEEKNRQYEALIDVLRGRLSDKEEIIHILKSQKGDLGEANAQRQEARKFDLERIADARQLIAKQDAEIQRLRHPGFFASLFDKRTIYGAVGGFGACKAFSNSSSPFQIK